MKWFIVLILFVAMTAHATFAEFYCDNAVGSSNVFAGSTTGAPVYSSFNGNWNGTAIYTPVDGSTPANTVSAGMWASVYVDGAVVAVYVARVLTVAAGANGAITLSTTAISGTAPTSNATGRTIRVGGVWHGPGTVDQLGGNGGSTNYFPFDFVLQSLTNTATDVPRINFKSGTTYAVTNAITHSKNGPIWFEGYTTSVGDGGQATIDGGTAVAGYTLFTMSGAITWMQNMIFSHNGNSGTTIGMTTSGGANHFRRCIFSNMRADGLNIGGTGSADECEAFSCNTGSLANHGAFRSASSGATFRNCIARDNTQGTSSHGFQASAASSFINCIAVNNGGCGFNLTSSGILLAQCDTCSNTLSGFDFSTANATADIINCNFIGNTRMGITNSGNGRPIGVILNCGFGTGTTTNGTGDIAATVLSSMTVSNSVSYASGATPWVAPATYNFSINLPAAKAVGRGNFLQTSGSGTVAYPDIGAAQSASTNGGFGATFAQ